MSSQSKKGFNKCKLLIVFINVWYESRQQIALTCSIWHVLRTVLELSQIMLSRWILFVLPFCPFSSARVALYVWLMLIMFSTAMDPRMMYNPQHQLVNSQYGRLSGCNQTLAERDSSDSSVFNQLSKGRWTISEESFWQLLSVLPGFAGRDHLADKRVGL